MRAIQLWNWKTTYDLNFPDEHGTLAVVRVHRPAVVRVHRPAVVRVHRPAVVRVHRPADVRVHRPAVNLKKCFPIISLGKTGKTIWFRTTSNTQIIA